MKMALRATYRLRVTFGIVESMAQLATQMSDRGVSKKSQGGVLVNEVRSLMAVALRWRTGSIAKNENAGEWLWLGLCGDWLT
jgi:hypothetical protein